MNMIMEDNIIMMIDYNKSGNTEITTSIGTIRVL